MGVKICVRTSGMQIPAIKQHVNWFGNLKCQNTDSQNFPFFFLKKSFVKYNGDAQSGHSISDLDL